jgi:hypothetical protein
MLQFINVHFTKQVKIEKQDVEFINCIFSVEGKNIKDNSGTALILDGTVNARITNCVFKNKGYNSINIKTTGMVAIERNTFMSTDVYNPIEGSGQNLNNISIEKNIFNATCGNNYISFFHMAEGAIVEIKDNLFSNVRHESNVLRLSNPANVSALFKVENNKYQYNTSDVSDYTAFLICQEYGATAQDFKKYVITISDLKCNNVAVKDEPVQGKLYYVYKDGVGITTGQNDPIITLV